MKYILANKDGNQNDESKKELKLSKRFKFNKWAEIGENNLYFYEICWQLFEKIDEIFIYYRYYDTVLKKAIEFLKEDFNKLNEDQRFLFNYISYLLLDTKSITSYAEYNKINNFLNGQEVK